MKTRFSLTVSIFAVLMLVISACSSPAAVNAPPTTATLADATQAPLVLNDAEMEDLLEQKLEGSPHTLEFIYSQDLTAAEWSETLDRMIGYGAKINTEEKAMLIEWLINRK